MMTGRLVMYLNWRELLFVIAHNGMFSITYYYGKDRIQQRLKSKKNIHE